MSTISPISNEKKQFKIHFPKFSTFKHINQPTSITTKPHTYINTTTNI